MTKSELSFQKSESEITREPKNEPKNSAARETTNPAITTPFSQEATATVPRIMVFQKGSEVKFRPLCKDPHQGVELIMRAIGAEDMDFLQGILSQLAGAGSQNGVINQANLDFMLSIIKGIKPKDQIGAMLAAQMAVTHFAMMKFSQQLMHCDTVPQLDSLGGLVNKLARTFATQTDVLQRYRSGGEQKVTIQNVSVSEGGQAIVGNVTQKTSDGSKAKAATAPAAITDAHSAPMPIIERSEQPATVRAERRPRQ